MEKKEINTKFYLLSSLNMISVLILGGGLSKNSLILSTGLLVLVLNHTILVRIVKSVTSAAADGGASRQVGKILFLILVKFTFLFGLIGSIYYFQKNLLSKLFLIIFFQLIIQVVSIKNNYQNS